MVRVALAAPFFVGLFALGLLTRYDLEKLAALPVRPGWLRNARDTLVSVVDRLARAFEPRRAA